MKLPWKNPFRFKCQDVRKAATDIAGLEREVALAKLQREELQKTFREILKHRHDVKELTHDRDD